MDQFLGSGTTLIEAKLLNRNAVGTDVNKKAIEIANFNLNFQCESNSKIFTGIADARNLKFIKTESIDLICTHPPYADIIRYSKEIKNDISLLKYNNFLYEMKEVAKESYRVLKKEKCCTLMMGDIRKHGNVVPLGMNVLLLFLQVGFFLKEIIIKEQHNCHCTKYWEKQNNNYFLLAHEYIFVLGK